MIRLFQPNKMVWIFVVLLFFFKNTKSQIKQRPWFFKTRFQYGIEYDNNIEESRHKTLSDALVKLVVDSQTRRISKSWLLLLNYHGGVQYYFFSPAENKQSHDVCGSFSYQISKNFRFGSNSQARIKYFNSRDWHYAITNFEPFILFNLNLFQLSCGYGIEGLNYFNYNKFNFNCKKIIVTIQRRFKRHFFAQLKACQQSINYQRYALYYDPFLDDLPFSNQRQKDNNKYFSIHGSYQNKFLTSLEYLYQNNSSNSYGFSYNYHRLTVSTATPLIKGFLMRVFGGWQQKNYTEALNKVIVTELDSERENSNFLIIDISKDLTTSLSFLVRQSWYDNESPIPGRYYQKQLTSCLLEYRF